MRNLLALTFSLLLAACGGDTQTVSAPASWSPGASMIYAYPYDTQSRVAPTAPVVLQFSTAVRFGGSEDPADLGQAFQLTVVDGDAVAFTASATNDGKGVVLTPTTPLAENTAYQVTWSNLLAADGMVPAPALGFRTRAATRGAASAIRSNTVFQVERALPVQADYPVMDFSTLRLQFTQPLERSTLAYGSAVRLEAANGDLVPARVFASGNLLSIDPRADLPAGQTYRLKLTDALQSVTGAALVPGAYADLALTPKFSGPRATMVLEVPDSASGAIVSPLTGAAINNVPIASTLLGANSASQQAGNLYAELAYVPNFPEVTPLTMRRGNLLSGSSVEVKIVGEVPAGLNTGAIKVNVISDANGYMVPNPYSNAIDAPRQVVLTMDAAMSSTDPAANGAFTQDLLHIEVVGTAIVKDGRLVMDAVGVVELEVLGLDQAAGVLSFHLEGYADQAAAPAQPVDITAPTLQSWLPGAEGKRARPGDPVILHFSEPVDPDTLTEDSLQLLLNDGPAQPIRWRADGSAVVLRPLQPLAHNASYTVVFTSAITDLAGNGIADDSHQRSFTMTGLTAPGSRSPIVLAAYPGYPCVTTARNAASGVQGRCAGGKATDDLLPLPILPSDRSLQVQFSQSMNADSLQLGSSCNSGSFRVERISVAGVCEAVVAGRLALSPQSLRFTPETPWEAGVYYRYVLGSNGNSQSATANCSGSGAVCGSNGLPLQTQLLVQPPTTPPAATGGGPNLEIWFRGGARVSTVPQRLRGLPVSDSNANFVHDLGEDDAVDSGGGLFIAPNAARVITTGQTGLVSASNIGCAPGSSCPAQQFLFINNALDAEVAEFDPVAGGVRVLIHPSQVVASSLDVYANTSFGNTVAPTGLQVFRLRYAVNPANGKRELPVAGLIKFDPDGVLRIYASLDLYLDEPSLAPSVAGIPIAHNLYSYPLPLAVSGPVHFLPDGRMLVTLANSNDVNFTVNLTAASILPGGTIDLRIPQGTMRLEGVSAPIKQ
ncbi:MAG: Ig-like domain-containing protein [Pseudomonadota bacterium]